jgi:predicted O-methyltransferase YrrM
MSGQDWSDVDAYIEEHLLPRDDILTAALDHNAANNLPPIDVSAPQGKMLMLLAQMSGAMRILEIGTLGGYSTIWLARALPEEGLIMTLEVDKRQAQIARDNLGHAGFSDKVQVIVGKAADSLSKMQNIDPFDFIFIDADKQGNVHYVTEAIRLSRPGGVIVVDNVIREGGVLDQNSDDGRIIGTRELYEFVAHHPQLDATAIQTVGSKGWDGFLLARVQ